MLFVVLVVSSLALAPVQALRLFGVIGATVLAGPVPCSVGTFLRKIQPIGRALSTWCA